MEACFQSFQKAIANEVSHLEAQCNAMVSIMKAENSRLQKQLTQAEGMGVNVQEHLARDRGRDMTGPATSSNNDSGRSLAYLATDVGVAAEGHNLPLAAFSPRPSLVGPATLRPPWLETLATPRGSPPQMSSEAVPTTPRSLLGEPHTTLQGSSLLSLPALPSTPRSLPQFPTDESQALLEPSTISLERTAQPARRRVTIEENFINVDEKRRSQRVSTNTRISLLSDASRCSYRSDDPRVHVDLEALSDDDLELSSVVDILSSGKDSSLQNIVNNRWALLYTGITTPKRMRTWLRTKVREHKLNLRPFWVVGGSGTARSDKSKASISPNHSRRPRVWASQIKDDIHDGSIRVGSVVKGDTCVCSIHPEHKVSKVRTILQALLILFDVVDFPMLAFHPGESQFNDIMVIFSTIFWTGDILFSFLQGFHSSTGLIEMRSSRIIHQYFRGWFIFDISLAALDWVSFIFLILESMGQEQKKISPATKVSKFARITRGGRILRLAKTVEKMRSALDAVASSEVFVVCARIFGLIFLIILINHYVACLWFGIADGSGKQDTWIKVQDIEGLPMFDRYFYSLHWALTQFTPCTNDIHPANGLERFFASLVVVFALVVFSTFLSSLTTAIMQMKKLNHDRYTEEMHIREFMYGKRVPLMVANRVWHYYRKHYRLRTKIITESDVPLFEVLPRSLRMELRSHVHIPTLTICPILRETVGLPNGNSFGPALSEVVYTKTPASGQDIFLEGECASHMYFLVRGSGAYIFLESQTIVDFPDYIAEAVLWVRDWHHLGRLAVSDTRCELLLLDPASFQLCVEREESDLMVKVLRKYASLYAQNLEDASSEGYSTEGLEANPTLRSPHSGSNNVQTFSASITSDDLRKCSDLRMDEDTCELLTNKAFLVNGRRGSSDNQNSVATSSTFTTWGSMMQWSPLSK